MTRLSLRARLTVALVASSLFAVAVAALVGNLGLSSRLAQADRTRLESAARHLGDLTLVSYGSVGAWRPVVLAELAHAAGLADLKVAVVMPDGAVRRAGPAPQPVLATYPLARHGHRVGTLELSTASGSWLSAADVQLASSLNRLHLLAALGAVVAALVAALVLARTLTEPLRRIGAAAERLSRGELATRVSGSRAPELMAVADALNSLAATLQREEELRNEGVADLAHELRTPVNAILSRVEAAQDGLLPAPENLAAMREEALRLTRLLDDLARLADVQRPAFLRGDVSLEVGSVVEGAVRAAVPRAERAGVTLSVTAARARVRGDALRLEQVLSNLLANAIAATPPGGHVTTVVAPRDGEVVISVADTGCGIAPADLPHVFTRFWRADRSRDSQRPGSGIGLAIVAEIVRSHGGRVRATSTLGGGSTFEVIVPEEIHDSASHSDGGRVEHVDARELRCETVFWEPDTPRDQGPC